MDFSGLFWYFQLKTTLLLSCQVILIADHFLLCSVSWQTTFCRNCVSVEPHWPPDLWRFDYRAVFQMLLSGIIEASLVQAKFCTNFSAANSCFKHGKAWLGVPVVYEGFSLSWSLRAGLLTVSVGLGAKFFYSSLQYRDIFSEVMGGSRVSVIAHLLSWSQGHAFYHLMGV